MNFENFVATLNLQHFQPSELLINTACEGNTQPPRSMWGNIVPTVLILDRLRHFLGVPVHLISVYRAPAYNARKDVGGRPLSLHQAFSAADIWAGTSGAPVSPRTLYEKLYGWRDQWFQSPVQINTAPVNVPAGQTPHEPLNVRETNVGREFQFRGGLNAYETFVHIDTRGINADW